MNAKHYYLSVLLLLVATLGLRAQSKTVTLTEAGTLSSFISEAELTTITDLTIKGPINSADIITLRSMAGNLKVLNLLDANIVYSADSYYGTGSSANHTQNDIIGDYMFYGMTQLTKITLPKDVFSIGSWSNDNPGHKENNRLDGSPRRTTGDGSFAFARCVNLQEVVLPEGLLWIGPRTFEYCTVLTTISLPEGLEGVGSYAFSNCQALTTINLPATLGIQDRLGYNWTGNYIFSDCTKLSTVIISKGLYFLPDYAFNGCTALESIALPDGLLQLKSAFANCTALKSLTIPASVTEVGSFAGCSRLTELVIPDKVTDLVRGAFKSCTALTKVTLPANLGSVSEELFANCISLTAIVIPNKVTTIGFDAFYNCTALKSITFSSELNSIESRAFKNCKALDTVELPSKLLTMGYEAFSDCSSLKSINLPQSLAEIGYNAFYSCTQLTAIKLPSVLMTIQSQTFYGCENLSTVEMPAGLMVIEGSAFEGCKVLKKITIPGGVQTINQSAFKDCGLQEVVLGEGIITLAENSFAGCNQLEKVIFPASMKTISGFNGSGIKTIAFAEGAAPEAIGIRAFAYCDSLRTVVLPNSINTIGGAAFNHCSNLQTITLPTSITKIPNNLFSDCPNLRSLVIPEGVTEIEYDAFVRCYKLASVSLPSTLTKIGGSAFYNSGIESITIPEGVTTLYGSTFYNCDSLTTVKLPASLARITKRYNDENNDAGYLPFANCDRIEVFDVSKAQLSEIPDDAFGWLKIRTLDLSAATVTAIPSGMCRQCDSLRSVKLPEGIKSIGDNAFLSCDSLEMNALPDGIETIGRQAFAYCANLGLTSLPASLKTLGSEAFRNVSFSSLSFPEGVTSIASSSFSETTLNDVTIPETVTAIEESAFYGAEVKGSLTFNLASNLSLGANAFYCSGGKNDASGNWYNYHLGTVNWNSTTIFPKDKFCQIDNLYLPEGGNTSSKQDIGYIFYNGITDSIAVAATYNNGRNAYEVKQPMKTRKVTYEKHFDVTSGFGEAAGWKTLVLPFAPTKITHTRGYGESQETVTLAPFGSKDLETEGVLPFWLYELGTDGNYKAATAIEANKAYLICMPNNNAYPSENNISGDVLFMAEDATNGITLGVTEGALKPSTGTKFDLIPTYEQVDSGLNVYTLNENSTYYGDDKTYPYGSVFVQDYQDVYPFQAYLVSKEAQAGTLNATRYYAIGGGDGTITGIEDGPAMPDQATRAYSRGGVLYIQTNADRTIYIYNVQGQTVRIVNAHEGLNEVRGLEEGIYMLEGQKVVVK